ncbi:SUMO ligase SIZ1, partial [Cyberlindnera jadinii NRRL Y-1542]
PWLFFRENPFYTLKKLLTPTAGILPRVDYSRGDSFLHFELSPGELSSLRNPHNALRVVLYCGVYDKTKSSKNVNIEFPHPVDITLNGVKIKDNVKGIKNKPGTAKPADLTPNVRASNHLEIAYTQTKTDYLIFCYLAERVSAPKILQKVLEAPKTPKESTISQIIGQNSSSNDDDELLATSTILSLKCPVSFVRMKYPVKSINCQHLNCFDALQYIYLQEQLTSSLWFCPICNSTINVGDLSLNEYVMNILKSTPDECESVEIEVDGNWHPLYENDD